MEISELRVVFVVDAIKGRNGVGTYFLDLVSHLKSEIAHAELISPCTKNPDEHQSFSIPMLGDPTQRLFFPRLNAMAQTFFRVKPHVVIIPGPGIYSLAAYWLARKMGIPVCVTYQTDYERLVQLYFGRVLSKMTGALLNWLNLLMFKGSNSVVTISQDMVSACKRIGVPNPFLVATPIAREFIDEPLKTHSNTIKTILFVGRLAAEKNVQHFLDLAEQRPDLKFKVIGDGPQRDLVEASVEKFNNIEFLGWQPRSTVIDELDNADLLILPSSIEAFGTVALEAIARQCLVMTAPACGINQWQDLKGHLFAQRQDETLNEALNRLEKALETDGFAQQLTEKGHEAAKIVNQQALTQWMSVLHSTARHHKNTAWVNRSPTLALLRRIG